MDFNEFIREWRSGEPTLTVRTSGSTGTPKKIGLSRDFVIASAERTNSFFGIGPESRLHSCVGADFIGGKMMAVRAEISGAVFTWETPSNRPLSDVSPESADKKISLLAIVPSQMIWILDHHSEMPPIENIIIGGSAIHPDLRERIMESGFTAYETYGMTETASHIALRKIDGESEWFETLPGITVSCDERGCLVIHFNVIQYNPELSGTRPRSTGWPDIITNDMAFVDGNTKFRITGRYDQVIITGGKKVNPIELEDRISALRKENMELAAALPGEFMITSSPDTKWGEKIVMMVATADCQSHCRNHHHIIESLKKCLPPYEVPKEIVCVTELPRTPNGKPLRQKIVI